MKKKDKMFIAATGIIALAIPAVVYIAAAQPKRYYIPSGSMEPTLHLKSTIRVQNNPFQNISQVQRGDIIVHTRLDKRTGKPAESIKRVVGLPGDKVQLSGTNIWVNGRKLSHVLVRRAGKVTEYQETNGKASYRVQYGDNVVLAPAFSTTVSEGHLLCLGDNRDNANDSRYSGLVPFKSIIGKRVP
jgi:signal peptidase I